MAEEGVTKFHCPKCSGKKTKKDRLWVLDFAKMGGDFKYKCQFIEDAEGEHISLLFDCAKCGADYFIDKEDMRVFSQEEENMYITPSSVKRECDI